MAENRTSASSFDRTMSEARNRAEDVVRETKNAAGDLYDQARESTADVVDSLSETASSFERTLRRTIETQPYTAVLVGVALGWLLGRGHRPF